MEKIPYSEQIRRGYNYLANRVHELKEENAKLKTNANAYREAYLNANKRAEKAEKANKELAGQLAAANINLIPKN